MPLETPKADHRHEVRGLVQAVLFRHTCDFEGKRNVLENIAPWKRRLLLKHHADGGMRPGHDVAGNTHFAIVVADQAADDVEDRRFAAARGSDDRDELARGHAERHAVHGGGLAVRGVKALGDVRDIQQR